MNGGHPPAVFVVVTAVHMRELAQPMLFAKQNVAVAPVLLATTEARFASLVERQSRFVFRVVWAVLRNVHDAEDVVQETFLKLYRSGAWEQMEDERAFLARAAWRMAVSRVKAVRPQQLPADTRAALKTPEQIAIAADWNTVVQKLIDALPEDLRQPLALSAIDELTSVQIALVMGISEGTVRTRIMRARQILKAKMAVLLENRHDK